MSGFSVEIGQDGEMRLVLPDVHGRIRSLGPFPAVGRAGVGLPLMLRVEVSDGEARAILAALAAGLEE